jgi:hypothetical protein
MKTVIVFSVLFFLSGIVQSQTEYFNERYPLDSTVASGTLSVVAKDSNYFISPGRRKTWGTLREAFLVRIGLDGVSSEVTAMSMLGSFEITNSGIIEMANGGMVNVWSMYDLDSFNYALVFYDNLGIEEQLVIDSKKFSYLYITDIQETQDHGFI